MEWMLAKAPRTPAIGGIAAMVGAIAFAAGFFGSVLAYPDSNLAPLLGVFITGPAGFVAGALFGVVRSSSVASPDAAWRELAWLTALWLFSLLYTFAFAWGWVWMGLMLQAAVVATAAYVLCGKTMRQLPPPIAPFRAPILAAGVLALLASIFPPVVGNDQLRFAFFLDPRFDARYAVPELSVDGPALVLEWVIFAVVALAIGFAMMAVRNQRAP